MYHYLKQSAFIDGDFDDIQYIITPRLSISSHLAKYDLW